MSASLASSQRRSSSRCCNSYDTTFAVMFSLLVFHELTMFRPFSPGLRSLNRNTSYLLPGRSAPNSSLIQSRTNARQSSPRWSGKMRTLPYDKDSENAEELYEIPVPTRGEVFKVLKKAAQPLPRTQEEQPEEVGARNARAATMHFPECVPPLRQRRSPVRYSSAIFFHIDARLVSLLTSCLRFLIMN